MNRPPFFSLFVKDSRAVLPWISIFWLLAALPSVQRFISPMPDSNIANWMSLAWWFQLAVGTIATARIVQQDSFDDPHGFLRTRPVARISVIAPKLCVIAIWLVIPTGLFQLVEFTALGFQLDTADNALAFADASLTMAAALYIAVVPALATRHLGYCLLVMVAGWIGVELLSGVLFDRFPVDPLAWFTERWQQARISAAVAAQAFAIAGALIIAVLHARQPSYRRLSVASLALGLILLMVWKWWPINFVAAFMERDPQAPRADWPDAAAMTWSWTPHDPHSDQPSFAGGSYNGSRTETVFATFEPLGIQAPWYVEPLSVQSAIHVTDGEILTQARAYSSHVSTEPLLQSWSAKFTLSGRGLCGVTLQQYLVSQFAAAPPTAIIRGSVTASIRRATEFAQIPARVGAGFTRGRKRFTVRSITVGASKTEIEVLTEIAGIRLRGDSFGNNSWNNMDWVLWNASTREAAYSNENADGIETNGAYSIRKNSRSFVLRLSDWQNGPLTSAWLEKASIRLITSEFGGTKTLPFEFGPLKLEE